METALFSVDSVLGSCDSGAEVRQRSIAPTGEYPNRISGFTLVEVLVVIAIIGAIMALSLPAIQSARESARRTSCSNNLRQLALAILHHEEIHQIFPTGGWGPDWVGDPDKGYGPDQPGGWIYNILPFLEEAQLRQIGKGLPATAKRGTLSDLLQHPISVFHCPSRRLPRTYPYKGPSSLQNVDPPPNVAKSDYAINKEISYVKSEVISGEIRRKRGVSKTVFVGEKSMDDLHYTDGQSLGDMLTMYIGDCEDIGRAASGTPVDDVGGVSGFGSAHRSGCNVGMGDGSVRFVFMNDSLQTR